MRARIFRMHRRGAERQPGRLARRGGIVGGIGIADRGDGPPEIVGIFAVEHGDEGIAGRHRRQRIEPRAVDEVHVLGRGDLANDRVIGPRSREEPEAPDRGLLGAALGAVEAAIFADFVEVTGPDIRGERRRRRGPELRGRAHHPRRDLRRGQLDRARSSVHRRRARSAADSFQARRCRRWPATR